MTNSDGNFCSSQRADSCGSSPKEEPGHSAPKRLFIIICSPIFQYNLGNRDVLHDKSFLHSMKPYTFLILCICSATKVHITFVHFNKKTNKQSIANKSTEQTRNSNLLSFSFSLSTSHMVCCSLHSRVCRPSPLYND